MTQIHPAPTVMALVPDYFSAFSCKGGACRNTCCQGWKVSLPMAEYFKLMNLPCEPDIQDRMARSLRLSLTPTPQTYGEFAHDYRGRCPLLSQDGWCDLHATCGAAALPTVCRQYPWAYRTAFGFEASMVNSCEHTLELLFATKEPLSFHFEPLDADLFLKGASKVHTIEEAAKRAASLARLSDRTLPLPDRILRLSAQFDGASTDWSTVRTFPPVSGDLIKVHRILRTMVEALIQANRTIEELTEQTVSFQSDDGFEATYRDALTNMETALPDHAIYFEKMLVNHLFLRGFPYPDDPMPETDAVRALIGTYAVLRYFALALTSMMRTFRDFVDTMAKIFRVVSHTRFEHRILGLMRDAEGDSADALRLLCAF